MRRNHNHTTTAQTTTMMEKKNVTEAERMEEGVRAIERKRKKQIKETTVDCYG